MLLLEVSLWCRATGDFAAGGPVKRFNTRRAFSVVGVYDADTRHPGMTLRTRLILRFGWKTSPHCWVGR